MSWSIRAAVAADHAAMRTIINLAFASERDFVDGDRIDLAELQRMAKVGAFWVVEEAGNVLGAIYRELRGESAYFGLLAVDPRAQGRGLGRALVQHVEAEALAAGCRAMDIRVIDRRKELPPFYRALGYQEVGTEPYPAAKQHLLKRPVHFLCMRKTLASARDA